MNEKCLERCPIICLYDTTLNARVADAAPTDPNSGTTYDKHTEAITHAGTLLLGALANTKRCPGPRQVMPTEHITDQHQDLHDLPSARAYGCGLPEPPAVVLQRAQPK